MSLAAQAAHDGIDHLVVGKPMEFWRQNMPKGGGSKTSIHRLRRLHRFLLKEVWIRVSFVRVISCDFVDRR
jgi:hypothetical protein